MRPSRRGVLAGAGAAVAGLAGCTGPRSEDLRFRNFTAEPRSLTVRIWGPGGDLVFEETVELAANFAGEQPAQPTRDGVFAGTGTHEVTAFLPDGPTATDEWTVDDSDRTFHVSVYDGPELTLGPLGPG